MYKIQSVDISDDAFMGLANQTSPPAGKGIYKLQSCDLPCRGGTQTKICIISVMAQHLELKA